MIDAAECVVIGSGALGSSVAFHLAKSGRQVALLDKHALGSQTSPRAAGLTSQARGMDLIARLAKRAVRKIREAFEAETGEKISDPSARRAEDRPAAGACGAAQARGRARAAHGNRHRNDLPAGGAGEESVPASAPGILGVIYSPTDLYLEPSQIPNLYARAAERHGVTMLPHTLVTGIATRNGAVSGVETEHGTRSAARRWWMRPAPGCARWRRCPARRSRSCRRGISC